MTDPHSALAAPDWTPDPLAGEPDEEPPGPWSLLGGDVDEPPYPVSAGVQRAEAARRAAIAERLGDDDTSRRHPGSADDDHDEDLF